jgi:prepilin-type N-terminal cleavage/methylation domain-containing protein
MIARLRAAAASRDGFTLIEIVISMVMIGIIFAIFSITMSSTIHTSSDVEEDSALQGEARAAVEGIARDLRQTYTGNGSPGIESMSASAIQFLSPDRQTPFHLRRISYRLTGQTLERASATSTNTGAPPWTFPNLSGYVAQVGSVVSSSIFRYYDANGAVTSAPADVAGVTIALTVATAQAPGRQFTYATSVAMRVPQ